ncbi:MAG: hypothetical protein A3B37_00070 [Candidatus Sungbacteria bacterium RIFCSPLOWO2_01_FULL_59_16]|uniref:Ribulose-phosphate 3-epimerase n=1 Tax=Candidatus Sungbacteria bacterium RIFCSPLOWO2_01_FULL_59_16 TaxID=1802280 RepID=A0A1G2LA38_9BACT|nr:MAG: hypothetical protein A3B37_00070 [Candidatus Sungbacteria bacterium RIFCSPLOWO2_01_FULL_59_16]
MVEIIPSINAETWDEVVKKIRLVEPLVDWVHIDVADGTFTPNALWHNPLDLIGFETDCKIEIHLMEDRPEERIEAWLLQPVRRVIVHYEVTHDLDFVLAECRKGKIQVGLSVASHTSWTRLKPHAEKVDLLQVLAVHPGPAGREFERHNLSKIKHLRSFCRGCTIEVDGGITPENADDCARAGANILVSANYIFSHPSPKMAIKELQHIH